MANAPLDENSHQGMTGLLNTNGTSFTAVKANPTNHGIKLSDGTSGSDHGGTQAFIDENGRGSMFAESSGGTLVALYVDSSGNLLVKST